MREGRECLNRKMVNLRTDGQTKFIAKWSPIALIRPLAGGERSCSIKTI
jgi:hypothetical protein